MKFSQWFSIARVVMYNVCAGYWVIGLLLSVIGNQSSIFTNVTSSCNTQDVFLCWGQHSLILSSISMKVKSQTGSQHLQFQSSTLPSVVFMLACGFILPHSIHCDITVASVDHDCLHCGYLQGKIYSDTRW